MSKIHTTATGGGGGTGARDAGEILFVLCALIAAGFFPPLLIGPLVWGFIKVCQWFDRHS